MLRSVSGLGDAIERARATFPARLAATVTTVWRELGRAGNRRPEDAPPELSIPDGFADVLAAALALGEISPRDDRPAELLLRHYFELMPRLRVEQLAPLRGPAATLFHTPLEWDRLPRLRGVIERLFALVESAGLTPSSTLDAASATHFMADRPSLASLYQRTFYGGFMPLLNAYPADLRALGKLLDRGAPVHEVIDRWLSAPLTHELCHGLPGRVPLFPPYLDECIAGYLGVKLLPEFAYPQEGESNALYAAPWLAQVGQALARAVGMTPLLRAHFGAEPWKEALPPSLVEAVAHIGWNEFLRHRDPHFLSSNLSPDPWMKLFFLATSTPETSLSAWTLDRLTAHPWSQIPTFEEAPMDGEILRDALAAMCLHNRQIDYVYRVERRVPPHPIEIDLDACRVTTAPAGDGIDRVPLSYLFPPAVAARLRAGGHRRYSIRVEALASLDEIAARILEGNA